MKTMKKIKSVLLVASLFMIGGAFTILFTSFSADVSPRDEDPVKKETSAKKKEVKTWRWEEMFPSDMREALEEMPVAWVLFSPLEWHGEAMAFGTDPIIGQHVLDKAWKQVGGVRIPTVYVGVETDFKYLDQGIKSHWGLEVITEDHNYGSINSRPLTLQLVIEDYLYFLKREGFKMAVVSTGHGGTEHLEVMKEVCERISDESFKAVLPRRGTIPEELRIESSGGHASVGELSLLGAINPNLVDVDKYGVTEQDRKVNLLQEEKDNIDFEKAAKVIDIYANSMARAVRDMYEEMIKADQ